MGVSQKPKRVGRVVSVKYDKGMPLVSVQLGHAGGAAENIPVGKFAPGVQITPEKGWMVVVDYLEDGTPFISDVLSAPQFQMPTLNEGSFTIRFNDSTALTFEKQDDDTYNVDIETDGDVTVSAGGKASVTAAESVQVDGSSITLGQTGKALVTDVAASGTNNNGGITGLDVTKTTKTKAE